MSLDNLIGRTLEKIEPDLAAIKRLMQAARRNIADSNISELSAESRFDIAYKAIMQLANVALQANGYRTRTSVPGHHQTMIQSLVKTIGLDAGDMMILDALRKQRNVADYSGDVVPESAMQECITQAGKLLEKVSKWLADNRPGYL